MSDQRLVQETVVVGLRHHGALARPLGLRPRGTQESVRTQLSSMRAQVGVWIGSLAVDDVLAELMWVLEQQPTVPWLVSSSNDPGAAARPLADRGATVVVGASLDRLVHLLRELVGQDGAEWDPEGVAQRARPGWYLLDEQRRDAVTRLAGLTSRERDVLDALVAGEDARAMADSLELAEHTARTMLKQVLRKLGVTDRVKAVLLVESLREDAHRLTVPHLGADHPTP
ncbi:LuxR C-terminal-related transcriptional regulator [Nocardioides sp. GY 10127]|uniref:helix-turn-helix transcriptional regulator n=1 Tax=Nocardioides sp. GY 10127 TaxID=2569762 RepID=UPI0010A753BE|nr:LuxR C-terminal-related transcriptional regulator [Nocardioides sp. GY 10127]TIC81849.1 response regulator transcription factor [Nocardioides sp. GY 10127]